MDQDPCRLRGHESGGGRRRQKDSVPKGKGKAGGYLLLITAAFTCPCHLPILLALTAGTTIGSTLSSHLWLTGLLLTLYFVVALALGLKRVNKEKLDYPGGL